MHLNFLVTFMSFATLGLAITNDPSCESIPFSTDDQVYVTCKGNFTEMEKLKQLLGHVSKSIKVFKLQDTILDVLPPDVFHGIEKPRVQSVVFDNASIELLEVPELGDHPLKSIRDTVDTLEIYSSSKVFAWDFPSLKFKNLQKLIIENSELISVTVPFFFWPELRFVQIQNCSVRWVNAVAFQGNKKLTILSLSHNKILHIFRRMLPKPAVNLYSIDLSFNSLETLPEDMFSEMDALQELKLDNNQLKFLNQNHLKQVWINLKMLWLEGNKIPCENLCWISEKTEKPLFVESSDCEISDEYKLLSEYFEECTVQTTVP